MRPLLSMPEEYPAEEIERDVVIHEAFQAIVRLYEKCPESAHWLATSAIIAGEDAAKRMKFNG